MIRRLAVGLIACLALAGAGGWYYATGVLIERAEAWIAATSNESGSLTHGGVSRAGFPFLVAAQFQNVVVASPGYSATAPAVTLSLKPWAPNRLEFETSGVTTLTAPMGPVLRVNRIAAALDRSPDDRERLSLDLLEPQTLVPGQPSITAGLIRINGTRKLGDPTPAIVAIDAVGLQSSASAERVDLKLEALWRGPSDLGSPPSFANWRDAGGEFELRDVMVTNGPARITGGAVITLDALLRPVPKGTITLQGIKPFMDRLSALGLTSPRDAAIGQTALALMARPGADGQPEVTLPLSGRDGWLMIGPLRTVRLPALAGP